MKLKPNEELMIWRRRQNLTQAQVSKMYHVSQGYVSQWEKGFRPVPDFALAEIPQRMKVTDGEQLLVRMMRRGYNMTMFAKRATIGFYPLLAMLRDKRTIPKEIWDVMIDIEEGVA